MPNRKSLQFPQDYHYFEHIIQNGNEQINAVENTFQNQAKGINDLQLQLIANEIKVHIVGLVQKLIY